MGQQFGQIGTGGANGQQRQGDGLAREEHETPIAGDTPDPSLGPLPELLPDGANSELKPAFHVRVTRRHLSGYLRGLPGAAALRRELLFCDSLAGCLEILDAAGQRLAA